jgi:HD-GYP domain-containing protein (c-di-GMP phosphodiesterase class II)
MQLDDRVAEKRERRPKPMPARERAYAGALALSLVFASVGLTFVVPDRTAFDPVVTIALVAMFAIASRVAFEIGPTTAVASQLVFIPLLFLAPLPLVPLLVAVGYLLSEAPDFIRRETHPDRWLYCVGDAWFAVGPVLVIGLLAPGPPAVDHALVYGLAVLAQATITLLHQLLLDTQLRGVSARESITSSLWCGWIDAALSPIAFLTSAVAADNHSIALGVIPLLLLLRVFSKERTERYAAALELNQTYRGTVMVLADVVEADDNYTASHCRSVVDLSVATADVLGLGASDRQDLETAALLHDVGKIAIPKEILNKPAKLTHEEFELMKSHTLEGQALLDRVGGRLARVGQIVRSCHERWDGQGYPDGLRGEEIPLAARIVFCCDAYSAMTTDRPYRAAMSPEAALAELRANSGTQFEPRVVDAVCEVVAADSAGGQESYADAVRAVLASSSSVGPRVETV